MWLVAAGALKQGIAGFLMDQHERQQLLFDLDEDLLIGGVVLSEWCVLIVRECDLAFVAGADLATIITAAAAMETHLRAEYGGSEKLSFAELINRAPIDPQLAERLHRIRQYRNRWVHVATPAQDACFSSDSPDIARELQSIAIFAQRVLRETLYENQWL